MSARNAPGGTISALHDRGVVLDLAVFVVGFVVNVFLVRALGRVANGVLHAAAEDAGAKLAIGLFFLVLVILQPVGPVLKRWSFHQRHAFSPDSWAGCVLFWYMFVYFVMMVCLSGAAAVVLGGAFSAGEGFGVALILAGFAWSIISVVLIYRYFVPPKKPPRSTFLTTPAAARLGDASMYLNAIGLQLLWSSVTASGFFTELVTKTPLGRAGSASDIVGRLVAVSACAVLLYFPARIFFLVDDKHRALSWTTMLLANLPLILRITFAPAG